MREAQGKRRETSGEATQERDKVEVGKGLRSRAKGTVKNIALYPAFVDSKSVDKLLGMQALLKSV